MQLNEGSAANPGCEQGVRSRKDFCGIMTGGWAEK